MTFSRLLTEHASPTLAGLKCACLFSLRTLSDTPEDLMEALREKGLHFFLLRNRKDQDLLLAYRPKMLIRALRDEEAEKVLKGLGYDTEKKGLESYLEHLRERFLSCVFPHEIGLFLDYPVGDVKGFIENRGKNFKFSGLWKVYENEEKARGLFMRYEKCKRVYTSCYERGTNILRLCITA